MKKLTTLLLSLLLTLSVSIALVSCGGGDGGGAKCTHVDADDNGKCDECGTAFEDGKDLLDFTGISFSDLTVTYDGSEHTVTVSGTLPDGAKVTYDNNKGTNAGSYDATATLKCAGYADMTLTATLVIEKADITGITFESGEFTYDGSEKAILIAGELPDGVSVTYDKNKATNAGIYDATATMTGANYNTLTLDATLTVNKADITGISAEAEQSVKDNGEKHLPVYTGTLPAGASVKYIFNGEENNLGVDKSGNYEATIVIYGDNYNTLELPVAFKIKADLIKVANAVIESFGSIPDPWSFFPESFKTKNFVATSTPDYTDFVNVSSIPQNGRGKQLNAAYSVLNKTESALVYVNTVYQSLNAVKTLYTEYLDGSPENYKHFEGSTAAFSFVIDVTETSYILYASVGPVSVTLYSNIETLEYGVKIQLRKDTVVKCNVSSKSFTIALDILDTKSTLIDFWRDDDGYALGMIYDYTTLGDKTILSTKALIEVGSEYTVITGNKGDFLFGSDGTNCEVYDNATGKFVGAEVRESTSVVIIGEVIYNTYWFPLANVSGITSIKKEDTANKLNPDTIWINGCTTDKLHSALYGGIGGKSASRMFDIEFKTMYFYTLNTETGEYESVEIEIPMIFIQDEKLDDFNSKFSSENKTALNNKSVTLNVPSKNLAAIKRGYEIILPVYDALKDAVKHEDIVNFCKQ